MYSLQEPPDLSSVHYGLEYETCSDFLGEFCSGQRDTDIQFMWCQSQSFFQKKYMEVKFSNTILYILLYKTKCFPRSLKM